MERFKNIAFGLQWKTTINDTDEEIKALAKTLECNAYVDVSYDGNTQIGLCKDKKPAGLFSAAAAFAKEVSKGNAAFIHDFGNGKVCLIVVKNFLPVLDEIVSRSEAMSLIPAYAEDMKLNGRPIVIYGDSDHDEFPAFETSRYSLAELEKVASKPDYALFKVESANYLPVVAIAAILISGVVIFSSEIMEAVLPTKKTQTEDPALLHKQNVQRAVAAIVDSNSFPVDAIPAFETFAEKNYPYEFKGWKLHQIACIKGSCTGSYARLPGGTTRDLQTALGLSNTDQSVTYTDVDHASRALSFSAEKKDRKLQLVTTNEFTRLILSWFQKLKDAGYTPMLATPTALVPPPANVKVSPEDAIKTGMYTFDLPREKLKHVYTLPNFMTVETITLTVNDQSGFITAKIEGKYYAY